MKIGIVIPTYQSKLHLKRCLEPLLASSLKPHILIIDSSSTDGTIEEANRFDVPTLVISRQEFNHGTTRERARKLLGTPIVVMMTPDAYPQDPSLLEKLVQPLLEGKASLTYARQMPHDDSDIFEAFPRKFNYPIRSHIRGIEDLPQMGIYTFFCSNSCSAYRTDALDEVGGFPPVLFGEDSLVAAKLVRKGHKIGYVAEAVVYHSHRYTLQQEFRRHFDMGYSRKQYRELLDFGVTETKRGKQYVFELLTEIIKNHPWQLPYALLHILAKWSGFRLGQASTRAPEWMAKRFSSQDFYWDR